MRITLFLLVTARCFATIGTPAVFQSSGCSTGTTCAVSVTMPAGELGFIKATAQNTGITISSVSGGGSWYHPGGGGNNAAAQCAGSDSGAGSMDCVYVLSSSSTSNVTVTFSGSATSPTVTVALATYTNGPIQAELPIEGDDSSSSTSLTGASLWLGGTNDIVFQAIHATHTATSIGGGFTQTSDANLAYLNNTTTGTAPSWGLGSASTGAVLGIGFAEYIPITGGLSTQWITYLRAPSDGSTECFTAPNVSISSGFQGKSQTQSLTCADIDVVPTGYSYSSYHVGMRSFSFLYGTVEFRAKFGGGASSGSWPVIWMLDSSCQPSDPTGTDSNCTDGQGGENEVDITEILNSTFTSINQQIHIGGTHNDQCTASVTDASANYHTYDLVWSAGSLIWKIDGTTTCTITQSYVPSRPLYLKMTGNLGGNGGSVNGSDLPWTTNIQYVTVTQSSTIIFEDYFLGISVPPFICYGCQLVNVGVS